MAQPCAQIQHTRPGRKVSVCVQVITRKQVQAKTKDGLQPMSFVTVEDSSGILETVWFNDCYRQYGPLLDHGDALLLTGKVQIEYGFVTLQVERAEALTAFSWKYTKRMRRANGEIALRITFDTK